MIMKKRQIIYSSTIIVLGIIQLLPCVLLVSGTIIGNALGIFYALFVWYLWTSTKNGRWFSVELYRSTLRLEKFLLGCNVESD